MIYHLLKQLIFFFIECSTATAAIAAIMSYIIHDYNLCLPCAIASIVGAIVIPAPPK